MDFGKRNEITPGVSQRAIVLEASNTLISRMQTRLAYEDGEAGVPARLIEGFGRSSGMACLASLSNS